MTVALLGGCIGVFVLAERAGDTTTNSTLLAWGAVWREAVWAGEWWRLVSSFFIHIGLAHLSWNVVAGFGWASKVEARLGSLRFLLVYLAAGTVGAATSVLAQSVISAGASGALFGCLGAESASERRRLGSWTEVLATRRWDAAMTAMWLASGLFLNFDTFAHLGGLATGLALATWFETKQRGALVASLSLALLVPAALAPTFLDRLGAREDRGASLQAEMRWEEALAEIDRAMIDFGPSPFLYAARAASLSGLGRRTELTALFETVPADMWSAQLRVAQPQEQWRLEQRDAALATINGAVADWPHNIAARIERADMLLDAALTIAAAEDLDLVRREAPTHPDLPALDGLVCLARRDFECAHDQLARAPPSWYRDKLDLALKTADDGG